MSTIPKTLYEKYLDDNTFVLDIVDKNITINYDDNAYRHGTVKAILNDNNLRKKFFDLGLTASQYRQGLNQLGSLLMVKGYGSNIFHLPKDLSMALSDTNSTSNIEMIRMPHRAFFVDINREDLSLQNGKYLIGVFFFFDRYDGNPDVDIPVAQLMFGHGGPSSDGCHSITSELTQRTMDQEMTDVFGAPLEDQEAAIDKNVMTKCTFLCFNILLYMSSEQADMKRVPAFQGDKPKKKKAHKDKICRVSYVVLGRGFRYSSGSSSSSSNRAMMRHSVSGHWKHQLYGPRSNTMYKTIWIQPYWRGDDIAGVIEKRHYFADS